MKNCYSFIFSIFAIFACMPVLAQQEESIHFKAGNFATGSNISKGGFNKNDLQSSLFLGKYFALVQFTGLPSDQTKQSLKNAGLELGDYLPGKAYFATIKNDLDFSSLKNMGVSSVNMLPSSFKIDANLNTAPINIKDEVKLFAVSYYPSLDKATVQHELQLTGAVIVPTKFSDANIVFIQPDKNLINAIASLPFVSYIRLQNVSDKILNYKATQIHALSSLLTPAGRKLSGRGVTVGIGDNSEVSSHVDFTGRLINRVYAVPSYHGLHTTGTVIGGGLHDPLYHGMAPRATVVSQWFSDVITNTPAYVADYNMIATNNSYTDADDACPGEGVYDAASNYADAQLKNYETVLHVFAAGNDGGYSCSPYPAGYGTVKSGWQCAKNVISVGAINQVDYTAVSFSSRGPVQDGRIKPEIMASGLGVLSTRDNSQYGSNSGTSMAAPVVTGAATILNERYRQLNGGATPKAALIKALFCNNAEDLGNAGPDYTYGFGMLNARKAVEAMEANRYYISTATPASYPITVPAGVRRLKVMLYWADPAAAANAATTLVNDLDLNVSDALSNTFLPLVLNPNNVTATAVPGVDHTNNIEQVVINNPTAGNFSLNVSAFAVPQGPQEYILTYQMEMNGITVEYPFGGETLVPGETETIRWTAYGDEANSFTVEYSTDNGGNWTTINNNVVATARSLVWTVPATITNNALIRVSRNSSAYTDQSDYNFVILGQPVVSATVPCEGYVQLSWAAITGATSYDIVQLKGDTMCVIANTASLNYLINGLNSSRSYWFGVIAKNSGSNGRRSISVNITPATGVCTLSTFDNNFKAVSIDAPITGRQFTTGALTSTESVKLTIKNLDDVASSGSYDLYYQVNGGPAVMESDVTAIASLSTNQYVFAQKVDLSAPGVYNIKAWVKRSGDTQPLDDTVSITIKNLANPSLILPVNDGFETTTASDYIINTMGLDGDDRVDFKTNSARGRARTFVNTGFALNGNRAITLDQFPYGSLVTDSLLMTYNINAYNSGNQLRFDFSYKNHGQDNNPNNKVWMRGSDTDPWIVAYDLVVNQAALGNWKHASINVNDVLNGAIPPQAVSTSFQVKIGQQGNTSSNVPNPQLDQDDGYTVDDASLVEAVNDVAITSVVSPAVTGCGMGGTTPVAITIKNYSSTPFINVPVYYSINGGAPVTEMIPIIGPNEIKTFTFFNSATLANNTDYSFSFWLSAPADNYSSNDSVINYTFHTSPVISSFPYLEGFESNDGSWYQKGSNSSWAWGTPAKAVINKAANGNKAWVTSLNGNYRNNELSYLYSPCFDLHTLTQPVLSFSHIFEIEDGCPCDYTWVDYSTDGGITWNRLGSNGSGINWYNDPTGQSQWRTSLTKWHVASIDLPTTGTDVRFRFAMSSDAGYNTEGVAIDDIHVFDKAQIYTGPQLLNTTQTVSGSNWIHFTSGGKRIASINPNGQNMGSTSVDVYPYSGAVRSKNNQYYLDRNIVIRPASQPAGNVSVRFYFTDTEAKNLVAATGCGACSKPGDPYELGVTKYSGPVIEENGTLADNYSGAYNFILPANTEIVPYDNGYYAEFSVSSFSEFWMNNGGVGGVNPLPLSLISFEAVKQNKKVLLQWSTDNEVNTNKFVVERSADDRSYKAIGDVVALNRTGLNNYNLTDDQPLGGMNFYRLRLVDKDGGYHYSPVRRINFGAAEDDITIYPNPISIDAKIFIASSANCDNAIIYDATGKEVRVYQLKGRSNEINLFGIARGTYQLKIFTENSVQTKKIVIQ